MKLKFIFIFAVLAIILVLTGCGAADNDTANNANNSANGDNGTTVAAPDAEKLYRQNCISCHGTSMDRMANLTNVGSRLSEEQIAEKIRKGGGGMIPFENQLEANEIEALAVWLSEKK